MRTTLVVAVLVLLLASSVAGLARGGGLPAPPRAPPQTPSTVTFTGDPSSDFPADALLYTNMFTPWGAGNNLSGLYGTWDSTNLYLAVSGVNISGNQMLFAVSNGSAAWGTENLTSLSGVAGASYWDRLIDFTQPMNYLFILNGSYQLTSFVVTSAPGSATTTLATLTPGASDIGGTSTTRGALELALPFTTIYPAGFPDYATVSLYAGIFGGSGGYIGPTIPSGQSYDVNYQPVYLTSHDRPGGYVLENTFYHLYLDPSGLGMPESGITPNYVENDTFHSVAFTGALATDFAPGEKALINTNTMYGSSNLLNSAYVTWDQSNLYLGFNASISNNYLYFFLGNDTGSPYGLWSLNATSNTTVNRPFVFDRPVNFVGVVHYPSSGPPAPVSLFEVSSFLSGSNTSSTLVNVTSSLPASMTTSTATELAIPFNLIYNRTAAWPVLDQFANFSLIAAVVGGGGPSTGPTLPAGQGYAYTGYYNQNHTEGYNELLNTWFTENLDPYGDGVAAPQINPTYTYGHTYHTVTFTGTPTNDFAVPEMVGVNTLTPWGSGNLVNATYLTWNYSTLFVGTNSTVAAGNWFMVALSAGTGVGATNFSTSNVANLTRNFLFSDPINFVFLYAGGAPNGTLFEVNDSTTTSTSTVFMPIASVPLGTDGDEFAIPFSAMYPGQPSVAGADAIQIGASVSMVALIYGGPGAYIGPTIPSNQSFSSGTAFATLGAYVTVGLDPNKNGYAEPGLVPSTPAVSFSGAPISLNIVFNDHQPLYGPIGGTYALPWTVVHLQEYAEQALLAGLNPSVNITYSLSGSLLYQFDAIAAGDYNNSYLEAAWIPSSQWGNSIYTEVTTYNDAFLSTFVQPYQYNSTTVAQVLEYDLAFNTPLWAYSAPTASSALYTTLHNLEQTDTALNTTALTESLVEFFLWSTSYPIITGQLGAAYINSTMWSLFNASSFELSALKTIQNYYPVEAALTLASFMSDRMLNNNSGGNVELITTPFDHPILPLLLMNNWTDENGAAITKGVWANDTTAQLQIGAGIYQQQFGQAPLGLWSPEQAVSAAIVPYVSAAGYTWTSSSQAVLSELGIAVPGSGAVTAQEMQNLYAPYKVTSGSSSVTMVFRDDSLSNDWGFNYGTVASTSGNWAAVNQFIGYLQNVYATVPRSAHNSTVVTLALDGENWMFMSPFPEDGVPFLADVYTALEQNSSWLSTTTMQQYLADHTGYPSISNLPTGSWNNEPSGSGINSYLGQWAGHNLQDATWQQTALVRSEVAAFGMANHLTEPMTLAALEPYNSYPYLDQWNTTTLQGKYTEAWTAIYGAEGSDIYFTFDPADQSPGAQNAIVFENEVRSDLSTALTVLGLPLTPFLESNYVVPANPTIWGTNTSISPTLTGSLYTTATFPGGVGYSVNHNDAWAGAYQAQTGNTTAGSGTIADTYYAFDASNLYFSVAVNGPTSAYVAPNFYTGATDDLNVYFSTANPGAGDLLALGVPSSVYAVGSAPFGFAATTEATIEGSGVAPSGSTTLGLFSSTAAGTWVSSGTVSGDAFVGNVLQMQVPLTDLGMVPGESIEFFVASVNGTTGAPIGWSGPMEVTVPISLAKLSPVATIHNTALDNGPGNYVYPTLASSFPPQSFDMQWVNVSDNPYTVQFNVTFGNLSNVYGGADGFTQPIIDIYIHESSSGGNTSGLAGTGIDLAPQSAWQWVIQASGYPADNYVESAATLVPNPAPILVSTNLGEGPGTNATVLPDKTVTIQVPTSIIGSDIASYSYVIIAGSQDGYGVNGWRIVDPTASEYQGGGALYKDSPNVFSYIAPAMVGSNASLTQQDLLGNYTNTSYAQLVGITLPVLNVTHVAQAVLGASAVVSGASGKTGYYAVGSEVYTSTSTDGYNWTGPSPWVNLSFVPAGLAAVGGTPGGLLAWNGTTYAFVDLATGAFTNGTASAAIGSAAVTYDTSGFLLALDIGGSIEVGPPGAAAWATDAVSATGVGLSFANGTLYVAYTTGTALTVVAATVGTSSVTFGATVLTTPEATGTTVESLALAADTGGSVAVVQASLNASGSNIYLTSGAGNGTWKTLTSDGQDTSPSLFLVPVSGTSNWSVYVGFTNHAGAGNVFFLVKPVGTVAPKTSTVTTTPPPTKSSSSSSIPEWEWIVIGVVVLLVIIGIVAALAMRRGKGGGGAASAPAPPPSGEATTPPETDTPAGAPDGGSPPLS